MLDRLFEIFSTTYLGIIGAIIIHAALLFTLLFGTMDRPVAGYIPPQEQEIQVELMDQDEFKEAVEEERQEELLAESMENIRNAVTDINDERDVTENNYSRNLENPNTEEDIEASVKEYEKSLFEKEKQNREKRNYNLPEQKDHDIKSYNENVKLNDGKEAFKGRGMAELDLNSPRRYSRTGTLKVPGYMGLNGGTIVILITVDQVGYVVDAEVDYSRTTVTEQFAINKALEYAKKERFVRNMNAPKRQIGTITYTYVPQ